MGSSEMYAAGNISGSFLSPIFGKKVPITFRYLAPAHRRLEAHYE